jgi:hypothetical protein
MNICFPDRRLVLMCLTAIGLVAPALGLWSEVSAADLPVSSGEPNELTRIDPSCLQDFVGNFVSRGRSAAVILDYSGKNICLLTEAEAAPLRKDNETLTLPLPESNGFVSYRIIKPPRQGHYLLRVSLNLGGSDTLIRYVVVSLRRQARDRVVHSQPEDLLMLDLLLPADVLTDQDAIKRAWQASSGR